MTYNEALAAKKAAEERFLEICQLGRELPQGVDLNSFVENRIAYMKASEAIWDSWFHMIADTGVKVRRS